MYELFVDGSRRNVNGKYIASAGFYLKKNGRDTNFITSKELGCDLPKIGVLFETYALLEGITQFINMKHNKTENVKLKIYTDCMHTVHLCNQVSKKYSDLYLALLSIFSFFKKQFKSIEVIHKKRCSTKELRSVDKKAYLNCLNHEKKINNCSGKYTKSKKLLELENRFNSMIISFMDYINKIKTEALRVGQTPIFSI